MPKSIYLYLFIVGLFVGYFTGVFIGDTFDLQSISPPRIIDTSTIPSTRQRNILVVGVDDLKEPTPTLESVWIIANFPGSPRLVLLPIFPLSPKIDHDGNKELVGAFNSSSKGLLNETFLNELKNRNLWWSDYVILDETAMEMILNFVGNPDQTGRANTLKPVISRHPNSAKDLEGVHQKQVGLLSYLCRYANQTNPSQGPSSILALIPEHIRTNLKPPEIINRWKTLISYRGGFSCVFPTLNP